MRFFKWLLPLLALPLFVACFEDKSTPADKPLSNITIEQGIDSVYNIYKFDTLVIKPVISQENVDKPLSYTWEIDLKPYSHDEVFEFVGNDLGKFNCRLIVENEDGKAFFPFVLYVNSDYEYGITVLSQDTDGKSMLSFMQEPMTETDSAKFTAYDCFTRNNPDEAFAAGAVDVVQSGGRLIIACQGGGERNDDPTIYYLNEKTMVAENILTVAEYADFKPTMLGIPSMDAAGVAYPILCENGNVYEFSTTEGAVVNPTKMKYNYAQNIIVHDNGSGFNYELLMWDNEVNGLAMLYNGYGPYYCSKTYHATREACTGNVNYFNGKELAKMTYIRMTPEQSRTTDAQALIVVTVGQLIQKVTMSTSFWGYNYDTSESYLSDNGGVKIAGVGACPVSHTTPTIANMTYYSMFFAKGNKVMRWNFTTSQLITNSDVLLSVGSDSAIITGFEMSADHKVTYVSFYEPNATGKNGSVWAFDTDKGTVLKKYENICYRPVKMIYKKK